jgi:predicted transposase/invertase (TIGR01784 family)
MILNSLLTETQKSKIKDLEILNPNIEKEYKNDKESRLDIKAKLDNENLVNIEVQIQYEKNIDKRTLYYWSKIYSQQLNTGSA